MHTFFTETDTRLLSPKLWKGFAPPTGGTFPPAPSGNPVIGFFDDFIKFGATSLHDGYGLLQEHGATVAQISSESDTPGIVRLLLDADNEEATLQLGSVLDIGAFRLLNNDFAFEARIRVDAEAIVAGDHGYFIGMATGGASGCCVSEQLFGGDAIYATANLCGFQHLVAEGTALDAMYQASGQTKQDGATRTALDTVHTLAAAAWVKVGFRYRSHPRRLAWFVNGEEVARIGESVIAAATFPDATTAFMQPTIGMRGADATAANIDLDWWACAQYQ